MISQVQKIVFNSVLKTLNNNPAELLTKEMFMNRMLGQHNDDLAAAVKYVIEEQLLYLMAKEASLQMGVPNERFWEVASERIFDFFDYAHKLVTKDMFNKIINNKKIMAAVNAEINDFITGRSGGVAHKILLKSNPKAEEIIDMFDISAVESLEEYEDGYILQQWESDKSFFSLCAMSQIIQTIS